MEPTKEQILEVLKKAQSAFMEKNYKAALQNYKWVEEHIQDDEENLPAIWIELGWCHYFLQNFNQAIHYLEKAVRNPHVNQQQVFDILRLIGFSYEYAGNSDKAIAYLQDALLQPVDEETKRYVYFELGKIFFAQNIVEEARPYLEKAQKLLLNKEDLEYLQTTRYYLGLIAFFNGNHTKAKSLFTKFIDQAPDPKSQAPGFFGMAHLFYANKEYPALSDVCEKVMQLDKDFYDKETLSYFLCKSYKELKMWDELEMFLPNLIDTYPAGRYRAAYPELKKALHERN